MAKLSQSFEGGFVVGYPLALANWISFPANTQLAEVFNGCFGVLNLTPMYVDIFIAVEQLALSVLAPAKRSPKCFRMSKVQITGW